MFVSMGDAVMYRVIDPVWIERWLRLQWLGIALVPAAYLHFSDEVLRTTNSFSRSRQALVIGAYAASFVFMGLALFGDAVVARWTAAERWRRICRPGRCLACTRCTRWRR